MTEKELEKALDKYFQKKSNLYNKIVTEKNTYKKVEDMLKYYNRFKKRIIYIQDNIDNIILKKSTKPITWGDSISEYKSELEKIEDIKEQNQKRLEKYKILVQLVETALEEIKDDKYFRIIELRYFDKKNIEDIAEILNTTDRNIKRHRTRLVTDLCEIIFPEEILEKIL